MKNVILTGGGTAGHVMPNVALLPMLKREFDGVFYIGSENGMEKEIISELGVPYFAVTTTKLKRGEFFANLRIPFALKKGVDECKKLLDELKPSVVFSKGGYVSLPVVIAARKKKIPVVVHESDYSCGLANKIAKRYATEFLTNFQATAKKERGTCVGLPVREELFKTRKVDKPDGERKILLVTGGSQGAQRLNNFFFANAPHFTERFDVVHIVGKNNVNSAMKNYPHYSQIEFAKNIGELFANADYVVSRSGANTAAELVALGKKVVFVPLPKLASRGDQILNAEEYKRQKKCEVLPEEKLTVTALDLAFARLDGLPLVARTQDDSARKIVDILVRHSN